MRADLWIGDGRRVMRQWADEGGIPTEWGPQLAHLVLTSPPFLGLRSYLPEADPAKGDEMGDEATPAEFLDALLDWVAAVAGVLSPEGSIAVELGDSYAGSGGSGGDYADGKSRARQPVTTGSAHRSRHPVPRQSSGGPGWPDHRSKALVPELFRVALAYGTHPLTGAESPAGRWLVRNVVTWCKPNPPVGALGNKFRPATSDMVIATRDPHRWFDLHAVRVGDGSDTRPPYDWWEVATEPYSGSHYATWPRELCRIPILSMCPREVGVSTGLGRRRIVDSQHPGWTDTDPDGCYRPGIVLDPFAGSGTTLAVATGHGRQAVGIDIDRRNAELATDRVGPLLLTAREAAPV